MGLLKEKKRIALFPSSSESEIARRALIHPDNMTGARAIAPFCKTASQPANIRGAARGINAPYQTTRDISDALGGLQWGKHYQK